ncbi:Citrate lyase subunit beta-like protein [Pseudovibrio axinellae]|uniref:Citrate lyase subunit beta-like protein n=1 Tax=Pseudovibrio axinellae TaxID=989403 RepID=A0A165VV73_9HYPH|nr:CoA ester lyase [Pseudovibrio axinellae]KZL15497.1 Citrate lyase subunit beta-like protein [Pseudovibrio axinellae]SEQ02601.1 citrate lyase subunit beta / citryl-CoA lyase [Pseudovibrio axinellae]
MVSLDMIRTPLFVPADRPDRFEKAAASGADAVILDLEDAVAHDNKDTARSALSTSFTELPVLVRINPVGTPWIENDLAALRGLACAGVILPKAEGPTSIAVVSEALGGDLPVMALIESANGLAQTRTIAADPSVCRLIFGSIDYCADLGCAHERDALLHARSELVLASRLAGIAAPIDGVTTQLDDLSKTRSDAAYARTLGMSGKLCIHPRQIAEVRQAFTPTDSEINWARRVLSSGDGAVLVDGAMVDAPVRIRAQRILAQAKPI